VPGVPGIGEKTASALLQQFGTLDNILANVDQVPGAKKQENLRAWAAKEQISRQLVRLDTSVPIEFDWEGWRLKPWDEKRLSALFRGWGFRTLAAQVSAEPQPSPAAEEHAPVQGELFPFGANAEENGAGEGQRTKDEGQKNKDNWRAKYHLIDTPEKFRGFFKELRKQKRIAIDLETTSLSPREAEVVGYSISWKEGEAYYLAVRGPKGAPVLDPTETLTKLETVLLDRAVAKVNQNIKYDLMVLRNQGATRWWRITSCTPVSAAIILSI
jgi:DNA polymerase I